MRIKRFLGLAAVSCAVFFGGCEIFREAMEESYASEDPTSEDY